MLLKAKSFFSPHHFFHKQAFKDRLSSSVDLCLQRQSKDVLGYLVFLGFFVFFWEVVFYILFLFLGAPYVKMITDLFKNNNDNILIINNY